MDYRGAKFKSAKNITQMTVRVHKNNLEQDNEGF